MITVVLREEKDMIRQLDQRQTAGLTVTLEWNSETGQVLVRCDDGRSPDRPPVCFAVPPRHARSAFMHPFAYA
jgi:hypothetical protein